MYDILAITTNIGVIGYLIYLLLTGGLSSFNTSYVFIAYTIFTVLTLPNLIAKVIFKARIVSLASIFSFLYRQEYGYGTVHCPSNQYTHF